MPHIISLAVLSVLNRLTIVLGDTASVLQPAHLVSGCVLQGLEAAEMTQLFNMRY